MEEFLMSMSAGAMIAIIIAILPFIAIMGTWNNSVKIRKHLDEMNADVEDTRKHLEVMEADLKHTNELLKNIGRVLVEIKSQGYSSSTQTTASYQNSPTMDSAQGEWLGSEQTRL